MRRRPGFQQKQVCARLGTGDLTGVAPASGAQGELVRIAVPRSIHEDDWRTLWDVVPAIFNVVERGLAGNKLGRELRAQYIIDGGRTELRTAAQ